MLSRADKQSKLKHNIEVNTSRAIRQWEKDNRTSCPREKKKEFRKEFQDVAKNHNDPMLSSIWND